MRGIEASADPAHKRLILRLPSLPVRILIGLVLGLTTGALLSASDAPWSGAVLDVARPVGALWLDGLRMTIVPLVFSLLVTGIASAATTYSGGGLAARALGWFAVLLLAVAALSAMLAPLLLQLWPVPEEGAALLRRAVGADGAGEIPPIPPLAEWLRSFVPANPLEAAVKADMVPVVVFALLFGLAATRLTLDERGPILALFDAIVKAMLVIVHWVLLVAPIGVFALALVVGATGLAAAGAVVNYFYVVIGVQVAVLILTYVMVPLFGRMSIARFARVAAGPQGVALGTASSLATLPAMLEASKGLDVSERARDVVLPMAVSLFRITNPTANLALVIYMAAVSGVALGVPALAVGALVAAVVSVASVGLPGQVSFFTTGVPICLAMGVPIELLPLLLAVETIPDLFRTIGNVTADLAITRIVGVQSGEAVDGSPAQG